MPATTKAWFVVAGNDKTQIGLAGKKTVVAGLNSSSSTTVSIKEIFWMAAGQRCRRCHWQRWQRQKQTINFNKIGNDGNDKKKKKKKKR